MYFQFGKKENFLDKKKEIYKFSTLNIFFNQRIELTDHIGLLKKNIKGNNSCYIFPST
jgi:hypothetical protein